MNRIDRFSPHGPRRARMMLGGVGGNAGKASDAWAVALSFVASPLSKANSLVASRRSRRNPSGSTPSPAITARTIGSDRTSSNFGSPAHCISASLGCWCRVVMSSLRAHDNRRSLTLSLGMELIAFAVWAASPVAIMVMSVLTNRAVKHFALLGSECLIKRFERRLRCL
jgi:hypothetical protein